MRQFEVWIADLNPRFGTEPGKTRPVLIAQGDMLNSIHPSIIICPITSQIQKEVEILRVNLKKGDGGIANPSAIMIDQLRAIDKKRLVKRLGVLPSHAQKLVKANIKIVLELEF